MTLPRRRTSPTHPNPTVTYGEWYVAMTSTCKLCPSSCPVHIPTTAMSSTSQLVSVVPSSPYFPPQHHRPAGSSRCQCDAYQNNLGHTHQCSAINLKSNGTPPDFLFILSCSHALYALFLQMVSIFPKGPIFSKHQCMPSLVWHTTLNGSLHFNFHFNFRVCPHG